MSDNLNETGGGFGGRQADTTIRDMAEEPKEKAEKPVRDKAIKPGEDKAIKGPEATK